MTKIIFTSENTVAGNPAFWMVQTDSDIRSVDTTPEGNLYCACQMDGNTNCEHVQVVKEVKRAAFHNAFSEYFIGC